MGFDLDGLIVPSYPDNRAYREALRDYEAAKVAAERQREKYRAARDYPFMNPHMSYVSEAIHYALACDNEAILRERMEEIGMEDFRREQSEGVAL